MTIMYYFSVKSHNIHNFARIFLLQKILNMSNFQSSSTYDDSIIIDDISPSVATYDKPIIIIKDSTPTIAEVTVPTVLPNQNQSIDEGSQNSVLGYVSF